MGTYSSKLDYIQSIRFTEVSQSFSQMVYESVTSLVTLIDLWKQEKFSKLIINDKFIQQFKFLNTLNLSRNQEDQKRYLDEIVSDQGINNLYFLQSLDLTENTKITDEGIKDLTNITDLQIGIYYRDENYINKITDNGLKLFSNITTLSIENNSMISDETLIRNKYISHLTLNDNCRITDRGLKG
jgi:hypothetical protein